MSWMLVCVGRSQNVNVMRSSDLHSIVPDLTVPTMVAGEPKAGRRVKQQWSEYQGTGVYHVLYLPSNWKPDKKYPVIFEYAGNKYQSGPLDISTGKVEGSQLGYGLSAGSNFVWVCLPFVDKKAKANSDNWWGDIDATVEYCKISARRICDRFGGDSSRLVLCGFSRGAMACGFIGLHDDEIASLWRAMIPYGVFDGPVYPGFDRASSIARLSRFKGKPLLIVCEGNLRNKETRAYLEGCSVPLSVTYLDLPFTNHNDAWALRDIPERQTVRWWLGKALALDR